MSGRQVVRGADVADLFFADETTFAFTRKTLDPSQPQPQDLWVYGIADAEPAIALPGIDWAPPVWWPSVRVGELLQTGTTARLFYDFGARQRIDLSAFGESAGAGPGADDSSADSDADDAGSPPETDSGATSDDAGTPAVGTPAPLPAPVVVRRDGAAVAAAGVDSHLIGVGPPSALQVFRAPGTPVMLDFVGTDLVALAAVDGADHPSLGIYRLDAASGAWRTLVSPRPFAEWGPTLTGCTTFGADPCPMFQVVGCDASYPACAETGTVPCAIVYVKGDPDNPGQTAAYAYDANAASDLKLPGQTPSHLFASPDRHLLVWDDAQLASKRYWDLCSGKQDFCTQAPGPHLLWRGDSKGFATLTESGQLAVADFEDNLCSGTTVAPSAYAVFYSPSGGRLVWLASGDPDDEQSGVWLANRDGSAPTRIVAGSFSGARLSPDESKLLVSRSSASSVSLAWIDLTASPPTEHRLVDNYGGFSRMGNRRVLLVDGWNTQDASGDLALLDMTTGARVELGRAVTTFSISGASLDDEGANVAYVARSRVSSDRDGLWLTTLPP